MSYSVNQDEAVLAMIDRIAAEPIDDEQYLGRNANPKPVVESVCVFGDTKVDFSKWNTGDGVSTSSKKVGKAKTAPTKNVAQVTEFDTTKPKKSEGKLVGMETVVPTEVKDAPKVGNGGKFDTAAKSAVSGVKTKTAANQKFADGFAKQRIANELFRKHVKSLCVDERTTADCEKILKKFDEITKRSK